MRAWWQEPAFWRDLGPFLFPAAALAEADDAAADVLGWLGLDEPAGERVLDAGCGVGRLAVPMAQRGLQVVAVDSIDEFRRETRRRAAAAHVSVDVRAHDLLTGPLPEAGTFAGIVCAYALVGYHEDPVADVRLTGAFRELLGPGGRYVLLTRHPDSTYGRIRHTAPDGATLVEERRFDRERHLQHTTWTVTRGGRQRVHRSLLRVYPAADLRGLLEVCGFDEVRTIENRTDQYIVTIGTVKAG